MPAAARGPWPARWWRVTCRGFVTCKVKVEVEMEADEEEVEMGVD